MTPAPPIAMLAELTHRCPLSCPYCSNPMELTGKERELDTAAWLDVFTQAAALGVLHLHLSGGEPLSRRDLEPLVAGAHAVGLYTNLITSGIGLTEQRLAALEAAGLDHVQLSLQGTDAAMGDYVGGYRGGFDRKMQAAAWIAAAGLPLTLNFVMHRQNVHQLPAAIALAERLGARRLEVATVQFHGWAMANRAALMPTREQAEAAGADVAAARERLRGGSSSTTSRRLSCALPEALHGRLGLNGYQRQPEGRSCPATQPKPSRASSSRPFATGRWRRSGRRAPPSRPSGARTGCRSHAGAANGARSTSAAAAARRWRSPATPARPILYAALPAARRA